MIATAGAEPKVENIWPEGKIPLLKETPPEMIKDSKDDIIRYTNVSNPTVTIYPAEDKGGPNPAILICPGGGYSILAWNHEGTEVAEWFNKQGVSAFVLKYRTPGQRDAAFCDAQRALRYIRSKSKEFNINPDKVGIMGFSAGGHLTVRVSNNFDASLYEPVDEADKLSCRPDYSIPVYPAYLNQKGTFDMVDEFNITDKTPITFIIAAQNDKSFIDCSVAYYIALKKVNVPVSLHLYPYGGHGFGMRKKGGALDAWTDAMAVWLHAHALK